MSGWGNENCDENHLDDILFWYCSWLVSLVTQSSLEVVTTVNHEMWQSLILK